MRNISRSNSTHAFKKTEHTGIAVKDNTTPNDDDHMLTAPELIYAPNDKDNDSDNGRSFADEGLSPKKQK